MTPVKLALLVCGGCVALAAILAWLLGRVANKRTPR